MEWKWVGLNSLGFLIRDAFKAFFQRNSEFTPHDYLF